MTIEEIAAAIGFSGPQPLYKMFKDTYGVTLRAYRIEHRSTQRK